MVQRPLLVVLLVCTESCVAQRSSFQIEAAIMFYYARFYLPIPYRVPVTIIVHPEKAEKTENPTEEPLGDVET